MDFMGAPSGLIKVIFNIVILRLALNLKCWGFPLAATEPVFCPSFPE